jgi:predicted nucleic acid-binding protein
VEVFFDTSVLVGASYGDYPCHAACLRLLEDAFKKTHFCAARAIVELYAVMTGSPVRPRITPEQGLLFVENGRDYFSAVTLSAAEQFDAAADRTPDVFVYQHASERPTTGQLRDGDQPD